MSTGSTLPATRSRAFVEQIMGMPISIHVRGPGAARPEVDAAAAAAFAELRAVDATFSPYRADSEIRRLAGGQLAFADASPLVHEVIGLCKQARRRTDGAFDARMRAPDGGREFDPSGLVKGWAAERAFVALAALEDVDAYLNAGGDVATSCRASERRGWRIGIEDPIAPPGLVGAVELRVGAIATSGTAHRGLHIRDPATGAPVHGIASVTVVGPSLLWADVFATAAFVRGAGGLDLLPRGEGYEGLVVASDGRLTRTPGFRFAGEAHAVPGWRARPADPSSLRQAWPPLAAGEA